MSTISHINLSIDLRKTSFKNSFWVFKSTFFLATACANTPEKENKDTKQKVIPIVTLPPPPDGGWGWVIVFAGFMINFLGNGSYIALGIFLDSLVEHFETDYQSISIATSISYGVYMCSMPINSVLINLVGCRKVCFVGGAMYSLGFFLTTVSSSIYVFYFAYGVMMGWACGFVMLSWMALVSFYFEKKRSLANAICTCGAPIGAAVWSPFGNFLLRSYGWNFTFWIFGGINLLTCLMAFVLKPLEIVQNKCESDSDDISQNETKSPIDLPDKHTSSRASLETSTSSVEELSCRRKSIFDTAQIRDHVEALSQSDTSALNMVRLETEASSTTNDFDNKTKQSVIVFSSDKETNITLSPVNDIFSRRRSSVIVRPFARADTLYTRSLSKLTSTSDLPEDKSEKVKKPKKHSKKAENEKKGLHEAFQIYRNSIVSIPEVLLNIDVISSEKNGEQRNSLSSALPQGSLCAHHIKIRRDTITDEDMRNEFDDQSYSVLKGVRAMLGTTYLKKPLFLLICLSRFFTDCAFFIPWIFMTSMMEKKEIDPYKSSFLFTFLGIANLISRLGSGIILDHPKISAVIVNTISTSVAGLSFALMPFCDSFEAFAIVGSIYGLFAGGYVTTQPIVLVDMFGIESLVSCLGKCHLLGMILKFF